MTHQTKDISTHDADELAMLRTLFADIRNQPVPVKVQDNRRRLVVLGDTRIEIANDGSLILSQKSPALSVPMIVTLDAEMAKVLAAVLLQAQITAKPEECNGRG